MPKGWDLVTALGVVGAGVLGGVFFTFSTFVMAALRRLPARDRVATMRSINVTAQQPPLMLALFGTAVVCGALVWRSIGTWGDRRATLLLVGAVLYIVGAVVVTVVGNIPLNNRLDQASPEADAA